MTKDFYTLADELRKVLRDMYPKGYIKVIENENSATIKITNFQPVPIVITGFEVTKSGTATIISK